MADGCSVATNLVSTGVAAKQLGIDRGKLLRWWHKGLVTAAYVTPGGHARWNLEELEAELRSQWKREG